MCTSMFSAPKIPAPPPPVEAKSVVAPSMADDASAKAVGDARKKARNAAALSQGRSSTILTGAQGLSGSGSTTRKSLLGN